MSLPFLTNNDQQGVADIQAAIDAGDAQLGSGYLRYDAG